MSGNVRITQVHPLDTPGCSSASVDNRSKTTSPALACIERKWSWIIVAASFWNQFIIIGILPILGLYNVEFLEAMEESKSKTAWITSVAGACILGLCIPAGLIIERTSVRITACLGGVVSTLGLLMSLFGSSVVHLSITFGVVMGFGLSMVYLSSVAIVGQYFQKRRTFASSISSCGAALGCLLMPPFMTYSIEEYTWRGSLFILAAICFQSVVFSSLFRPATASHEMAETSQHAQAQQGCGKDAGGRDISVSSCSENRAPVMGACANVKGCTTPSNNGGPITKIQNMNPLNNLALLLYLISWMLNGVAVGAVAITMPDFVYISLGSKEIAAFMLMSIAVGRIGGCIIASILGNWKPLHCLHMHCVSCVLISIVPFLYTCSANAYVFGILCCLLGVVIGLSIALITQVTVNMIGTKNLAQCIGYVHGMSGLGRLIGPPIAGALFDVGGDYLASFWMLAGAMLASGLLPAIAILRQIWKGYYGVTKSDAQG